MNPIRLIPVLLLTVALFLCAASLTVRVEAEGEKYEVADSEGFLGVYSAGTKTGYAKWTIKKVKANNAEYYRITYDEERTQMIKEKPIKETHSYNGTVGLDFSPIELKYEWKKPANVTKVTAKAKNNVAEIAVQFGTAPSAPPQKVSFKPGTTWAYCAPLCFGFAMHEPKKPADYGRLLEFNKVALVDSLTPTIKEITFQGEKIEAVEWSAEEGKVVLVTDASGKFLHLTEKSKTGVESKLISEPQDVAETDMTWEQRAAKKSGKKPVDDGEEKPGKKAARKDRFEGALDPVEDGAQTSFGPTYYKFGLNNGPVFTIRCADNWQTRTGVNDQRQPVSFSLRHKQDGDAIVEISIIQNKDEDDAEEALTKVVENLKNAENLSKVKEVSEMEDFEFDDTKAAGIMLSFIANNTKIQSYVLCLATDTFCIILVPIINEGDWDEYEDDIYGMLGSARFSAP